MGDSLTARPYPIVLLTALLSTWTLLLPSGAGAAARVVRIVFVVDGPWDGNAEILQQMRTEIQGPAGDQYDILFPEDKRLVADWTRNGVAAAMQLLLDDRDV